MKLFRRVVVTTVVGFLAGLFCAWGSTRAGDFGFWVLASVVANRTLMGFAIGISRWRMPWWLHGPIMGVLFGLPMALPAMERGPSVFWFLTAASGVYGLIIEFFASVVFRAKQG